jgi:hypothetical protein
MAKRLVKKRRLRQTAPLRETWGCPLTKNRSNWCYRMCAPVNGLGQCGRVAPHTLRGRTDLAIERYNARLCFRPTAHIPLP